MTSSSKGKSYLIVHKVTRNLENKVIKFPPKKTSDNHDSNDGDHSYHAFLTNKCIFTITQNRKRHKN